MENEIVYGRHSVKESLSQQQGNKLFIQEDLHGVFVKELKQLAKQRQVPVAWVPKQKLDQLTQQQNHQGVVLTVAPYQYKTIESLYHKAMAQTDDPVFLLLDHVEDPHNVGSILRTADATGVNGIIIPKHRATAITSTVAKTATGALAHVPIARVTNMTQAIHFLKEHHFWIYGTAMEGTDMRQWNVSGPIALVIGNEGKGMSHKVSQEVDECLTIPMSGHVQSLNASVAAGVMMYEIYRKRYPL